MPNRFKPKHSDWNQTIPVINLTYVDRRTEKIVISFTGKSLLEGDTFLDSVHRPAKDQRTIVLSLKLNRHVNLMGA